MSEHKNDSAPKRGPGRGPGPGPVGMPVEKAKDFKGSGKRLMTYMAPFKIQIVAVMILAVLSTIFTIYGPKVLARATDELASGVMRIVTGASEGINFDAIASTLLILGILYLISAAFSYFQSIVMAKITTKISYNMRNEIEHKINRLPLSYFHKNSHGDILSRITNDVDTLNQNLNQSIVQFITSICTIIGVLIMMLSISWRMTLIALCIIPVSLFFVILIVKFSQKHFRNQQKYLGSVNGQVEEMFGGQLVIKAFGREKNVLKDFDKDNDKLYESGWKAQFLSGIMQPLMGFIGNIGYVVICIAGANMASGGTITIGGIQAFIQYVRNFTQPITQLANISSQLQSMVAASERVFEFLSEEEEKEDTPSAEFAKTDVKGVISFKDVVFSYEDTDETVINNFSADVSSGQKVAIVGPTGAGKTTIVKLLMKFHEIDSGHITLDGFDLSDLSRSDVRSEFGMVLQDAWLYNGSIRENIKYGRLDATDDEIENAARSAQAHRFIKTLPGGYDFVINEDASNLSQGQKQLLTIARALLADSKVMILDEATSSVDTRTEILIQKAMDNLMKGRTSFIIAHRLSTIRNADLILCMKDGDIVEQGTHDELLDKDGFYASLYNSQFETADAS